MVEERRVSVAKIIAVFLAGVLATAAALYAGVNRLVYGAKS